MILAWYPLNHGTNVQICYCKRPLSLASLASSPIGGAKGGCAAGLFSQRGNNVGALRRQWRIEHFAAMILRQTRKNRPALGGAVDKLGWVRYTIDEKGTTSKAVPLMLG